jgi:hypothetical protein
MPLGVITSPIPIPYGTTVSLMARIRGLNGALITPAAVSTITYLLWNMSDDTRVMPSSSTRSLTVSDVVSDIQQNTAIWSADGPDNLGPDGRHGFVFKYDVPATDTTSATAGDHLRATITFTFTDVSVLVQL